MSYDCHGIIFICIFLFKSIHSCSNIQLNNQIFGHIENVNFYLGKSQPKNLSCSWKIHNEKSSYYLISLRLIEVEYDKNLGLNELILKTDQKQFILNDTNQRVFYFPSTNLEISLRSISSKLQSNSLNIHRFFLEFVHINNNNDNYFRCRKSGIIIPKQWKCNCLHECLYDDDSDEQDCSICSLMKSSNSLLCHSNEIWCLPVTDQIDPKGNNS